MYDATQHCWNLICFYIKSLSWCFVNGRVVLVLRCTRKRILVSWLHLSWKIFVGRSLDTQLDSGYLPTCFNSSNFVFRFILTTKISFCYQSWAWLLSKQTPDWLVRNEIFAEFGLQLWWWSLTWWQGRFRSQGGQLTVGSFWPRPVVAKHDIPTMRDTGLY